MIKGIFPIDKWDFKSASILQDFKREGILETKGRKVIIHNVHKLIEIINQ